MKSKVILVSNIFPLYREALWRLLSQSKHFEIDFYFNLNNPMGIRSFKDFNNFPNLKKLHFCKGIWVFNKILIWQTNVIRESVLGSFDVIILLGDMYNLSTWIAAIIGRFRNKKVVFWSHGFYGNESFLKKIVRYFFFKIPNDHLLYSDLAKSKMIKKGFQNQNLHVIYNSLNFQNQNRIFKELKKENKNISFFKNNNLPIVIYSGRLIREKKVDQLIKAIVELNSENKNYNLLIVGDGPERFNLENLSKNSNFLNNVYFYGSCYEEKDIARLIYFSDLMVSPGNIGLLAIHSLTYGTPVLTHGNFSNQMPEVEIIKENINGSLFNENSLESLKYKISEMIGCNFKKHNCREMVKKKYNTEFQIKVFNNILNS
jgi:glycosyltransferase involved in cell wall biosynthesis